MFISVDLPEPDAPMMATNSPCVDGERDAAQRVHLDVAHVVDLRDVVELQIERRSSRGPLEEPPRAVAGLPRRGGGRAWLADGRRPVITTSPSFRSPSTTSVSEPSETPIVIGTWMRRRRRAATQTVRVSVAVAGREPCRPRPAGTGPLRRRLPPPAAELADARRRRSPAPPRRPCLPAAGRGAAASSSGGGRKRSAALGTRSTSSFSA